MRTLAQKSKQSTAAMRMLDNSSRKNLLLQLAQTIRTRKNDIKNENQKDMDNAKEYPEALRDRLLLNDDRIEAMARSVEEIAAQEDVVGKIEKEFRRDDGLLIQKIRVPLGVILMIFESRPNVVIDAAALAIKSSNCLILKGGKEAQFSNQILGEIIQETIKNVLPISCIQVLSSTDRSQVDELLKLNQFIDVVVPRGGEKLIEHVYENAKMPVIAHYKGLCHLYIDESAREDFAKDILINAKTQRPGVCNAVETLILNKKVVKTLGVHLLHALEEKKTKIKVDKVFNELTGLHYEVADELDWDTEYLANILSVKVVESLDEALEHIEKYGSHHTEGIISENSENIKKFVLATDSSCVVINASTRFNDGGQLGLGAELGISTSKLHSYGPMGAEQMTTLRYVVTGEGHIRR